MKKVVTVEDLHARVTKIEKDIMRLQIERELVLDFIKNARIMDNGTPKKDSLFDGTRRVAPGRGCTPAIKELVATNPGLTSVEISDRLENVIETSSPNPRRLIQGTLDSLIKRKHLRRTGAGKIHTHPDRKEDES